MIMMIDADLQTDKIEKLFEDADIQTDLKIWNEI